MPKLGDDMFFITDDDLRELRAMGSTLMTITEKGSSPTLARSVTSLIQHTRSLQTKLDLQRTRIEQLEKLVETDELTGAYNRCGFLRRMRETLVRAKRTGRQGVLIVADVNELKKINDTFGHQLGDAAIRHFVKVIRGHTRADDHIARIGGDEFAILLCEAEHHKACHRISEFEKALKSFPLMGRRLSMRVSVSFGHATFDGDSDLQDLLKTADENMYQNKADTKPDLRLISKAG